MTVVTSFAAEHMGVWYFLGGFVSGLLLRVLFEAMQGGSSDSWDD